MAPSIEWTVRGRSFVLGDQPGQVAKGHGGAQAGDRFLEIHYLILPRGCGITGKSPCRRVPGHEGSG